MVFLSLLQGKIFRLFISMLVSLVLYPLVAQSEVFNVTNEDELRQALSTAESNGDLIDVVNIGGGVYQTSGEPFTFESRGDFSLTLEGEGAGITILDGGNESQVLRISRSDPAGIANRSSIIIRGVTIRNGFAGGGLSISDAGFVTIEHCEFLSSSSGAAVFSVSDLDMSANEFRGNSSGLQVINDRGIINAKLTNNIFTANGGGVDITISEHDNVVTLTNNTFVLNSYGLSIGVICQNCNTSVMNIYNNIFFENVGEFGEIDISVGFAFPTSESHPPSSIALGTVNLFNNDFSQLSVESSACSVAPCYRIIKEGSNIDEDPLFLDAEAGDVSLQPDSPCIDAGDPNAPDVPSTDFFANPRVPPPDMGAVELIPKVVDVYGGGGCSIAQTPVSSSLTIFLGIPALILMRRMVRRLRG